MNENKLFRLVRYYYHCWSPFIGTKEDKEIRKLCYEICEQTIIDIFHDIFDELEETEPIQDWVSKKNLTTVLKEKARNLGIKV